MWKFNLIPKRAVEKDYHIVLLMTINYLIKGDQNLRKLKWIHEVSNLKWKVTLLFTIIIIINN
jgi:hypothetical protein